MSLELQITLILFALFCVLLNGFFVAAEFAMVRVRATRLEELKRQGNRRATMSTEIISKLDPYLSATQLGITTASLALGWVGELAFAVWLEPLLEGMGIWSSVTAHTIALSFAFTIITFLHIVVGELAPKSLAIQKPESTMLFVAIPMKILYKVMYPVINGFNFFANLVIRFVGLKPASESELVHSEEELRMLLVHSQKSGIIPRKEQMMLERVFDFGDRNVHKIMVPRNEIIFLSTQKPLEENVKIARQLEHSRYPLCDQDVDHVIGMVHLKDLFFQLHEFGEVRDLNSLKREILYVPEGQPIRELMEEFQRRHVLMAIVVDEYGGTSGLVTLEDILEELVGEIQDEFDEETPRYFKNKEGSFLVDGRLLIEEAEKILATELSDQHNDTVGGHLLSLIGRRPQVGDSARAGGYVAEVKDMKGLRISKIVFTPITGGDEPVGKDSSTTSTRVRANRH